MMADKTYVLLDDVIAHIASCERSDMLPIECSAITLIKNIPAADVVEVVRCRDCVHGEHYYGGVSCRMPSFPEWKVHEKDYFCADGKRKDGGQE